MSACLLSVCINGFALYALLPASKAPARPVASIVITEDPLFVPSSTSVEAERIQPTQTSKAEHDAVETLQGNDTDKMQLPAFDPAQKTIAANSVSNAAEAIKAVRLKKVARKAQPARANAATGAARVSKAAKGVVVQSPNPPGESLQKQALPTAAKRVTPLTGQPGVATVKKPAVELPLQPGSNQVKRVKPAGSSPSEPAQHVDPASVDPSARNSLRSEPKTVAPVVAGQDVAEIKSAPGAKTVQAQTTRKSVETQTSAANVPEPERLDATKTVAASVNSENPSKTAAVVGRQNTNSGSEPVLAKRTKSPVKLAKRPVANRPSVGSSSNTSIAPVTVPDTVIRSEEDTVEAMIRYVVEYDGGPCFFATPLHVNQRSASLEGFGRSIRPFNVMHDAFIDTHRLEPDIQVRSVTSPQCAVVALLNELRELTGVRIEIALDFDVVYEKEQLSGQFSMPPGQSVQLFVIDDEGKVYDIGASGAANSGQRQFETRFDGLASGETAKPMLLLALLTEDREMITETTRSADDLLREFRSALDGGRTVSGYGVRYFKFGGR